MSSRCLASFHRSTIMKLHVSSNSFLQLLKAGDLSQRMMHGINLPLNVFSQKSQTFRLAFDKQINTSSSLEAGHSKWQNIKHIKAAVDRERGEKSNLLAHRIQLVLERNPDTDPKQNTELANLIKWARSNNLTNDVINNTIDRQMKRRDPSSITFFAGRGPSNTGIIIECFSPKPLHTKGILQSYVKKHGFSLHTPADDLFEHKGVVEVDLSEEELVAANADPDNFPLDKYVEVAIVVGAEDVKLEHDGEKPYIQFLCGPFDISKVSRNLNDAGFNVTRSERTCIPTVTVTVTQEFIENVNKLAEKLDGNSDVIKYHFNVVPES
ncbi:unnamed protein product [Candidula unifasciata]|uniref:Translational activator of cytochrome c oxidase 1 n=1 Tax=Candidula unifasciata TaxID=100452 RepID=A0A8S3ZH69_9EUPU|nr:unnamed protein product [Candidula unifasciata]